LEVSVHLTAEEFNAGEISPDVFVSQLQSYVALGVEALAAFKLEPTPTQFEEFCRQRTEEMVEQCRAAVNSM
jgi:hypothetical protein